MLQLFIYEIKEPNLKWYVEIELTSTEGRENNTASFFVKEPGPDVLSFDAYTPWTPSAHPQMADIFASTSEEGTAWSQSELKPWGQMRKKRGMKTSHLNIKYNKIIQSKWGYCFEKHAKENPLMTRNIPL